MAMPEVIMVFWRKRSSDVSPEERVLTALDDAERLLENGQQRAALKALNRLKGDAVYPALAFGGPHHERFSRLGRAALGSTEPPLEVATFPWERWNDPPTLAQLLELAQATSEPVLYLHGPSRRMSRGPLAEIEALKILQEDEQLLMVVIGEANTLFRRDLLLSVAPSGDLETEEILEELATTARRQGFRTLCVVG